VSLCEQRLKPVLPADTKRLAEALRNLDSDQFRLRDKAAKELESLGEGAEPALRQALAGHPSVEVRARLEQLLERLVRADPWRRWRALEVLEQIGSPEARQLLAALAHGKCRRTPVDKFRVRATGASETA
jgi:HEAT repeat protein